MEIVQPFGESAGSEVTSVSNIDGSLTISPTTGAVVASINTSHDANWFTTQHFGGGAANIDNNGSFIGNGFQTTSGGMAIVNNGTGYLSNATIQWLGDGSMSFLGQAVMIGGTATLSTNTILNADGSATFGALGINTVAVLSSATNYIDFANGLLGSGAVQSINWVGRTIYNSTANALFSWATLPTFSASTTGRASFNVTSGSIPSSPNAGDFWVNANHLYTRLNGTTYQLDQQRGLFNSDAIIQVASSPYTVAAIDKFLVVNTSSARQLNLPNPNGNRTIIIVDKTGTANTNNITLHRFGSEKISGVAADKVLSTNFGSWTVQSDGVDWYLC